MVYRYQNCFIIRIYFAIAKSRNFPLTEMFLIFVLRVAFLSGDQYYFYRWFLFPRRFIFSLHIAFCDSCGHCPKPCLRWPQNPDFCCFCRPTFQGTPSMTLPVLDQLGKCGAVALRQRLQSVSLIDLLLRLEIREKSFHFNTNVGTSALRTFTVSLYIPEEDVYRENLRFKFTDLANFVRGGLVPCLAAFVNKEFKRVCTEDATAKRNESFRMYLHVTNTRSEGTSSSTRGPHTVEEEDLGDDAPGYRNVVWEERAMMMKIHCALQEVSCSRRTAWVNIPRMRKAVRVLSRTHGLQ